MKAKQLPCELCNIPVNIRSKIKEGEHAGKKVCSSCKAANSAKKTYKFTAKKQTAKTAKKRKAQRAGLPEFFANAIAELETAPFCQNCGCGINISFNPSWNVAHILSKRMYKSVAAHPDNKVFLCSSKDAQGNNCHEKFDSGLEVRKTMPVYSVALQNFVKFKDECLERGREFYIFEENI